MIDREAARAVKKWKGIAIAGVSAAFVMLICGLIGTSYGLRQAVTARDNEAAARREADVQRDAAIAARNAEAQQRMIAESQRDAATKRNEKPKTDAPDESKPAGGG